VDVVRESSSIRVARRSWLTTLAPYCAVWPYPAAIRACLPRSSTIRPLLVAGYSISIPKIYIYSWLVFLREGECVCVSSLVLLHVSVGVMSVRSSASPRVCYIHSWLIGPHAWIIDSNVFQQGRPITIVTDSIVQISVVLLHLLVRHLRGSSSLVQICVPVKICRIRRPIPNIESVVALLSLLLIIEHDAVSTVLQLTTSDTSLIFGLLLISK